ncbi:hypothetical protein BDV09DRAFT_130847 [Aspergillus tetrazonus]
MEGPGSFLRLGGSRKIPQILVVVFLACFAGRAQDQAIGIRRALWMREIPAPSGTTVGKARLTQQTVGIPTQTHRVGEALLTATVGLVRGRLVLLLDL